MRALHFRRRPARGSTLIVTVVLLAVLTIVAVGLLRRGQTSVESVNAKRQYDASLSCAEGAREMLLGKFRAFNVNIADLQLNTTVGDRRFASGHYDRFEEKSVVALAGKSALAQDNAMGMANRTVAVGLGGAPYLFTVVCSDSTGTNRQTEVEFFIRFGI